MNLKRYCNFYDALTANTNSFVELDGIYHTIEVQAVRGSSDSID